MKRKFIKINLLISLILLTACSTHVVKLGDVNVKYPPRNPKNVEVYYQTMPKCDYREIALIDNPRIWYDSQKAGTLQGAVDKMRIEAAKLGADFIKLGWYYKLPANDKLVDSSVAYVCLDRKK